MLEQVTKKTITKQTFLTYTLIFLVLAAIIFTPSLLMGHSFIWEGDGFHQHYPFFRAYLDILRDFIATGEWQSWDWSISLGADTLMTYGYYVVGDPFVYLGLLFPKGSEELAFHVLMFVRIWAVGLSFLFYARKMQFSEKSALVGTTAYAFSHYVIYNVVRHPFFIHPLIWMPLIAIGIEKVFRKESGAFFALMIGLSAISNFYFFYMLTIMAFVYALVRYPTYEKRREWGVFFKWLLYFVGLYLLGVLLSAVIFLPQVYGFLNGARSPDAPPVSMLAYPLHYYGLLIVNTITPGTIFWTVGGFSVISILVLPFLTRKRQERPGLFWVLLALSVMLLFPFFGSMMNGFSGPYNRYSFVLPFYLAIALIYFLENINQLTATDTKWMRRLLVFFTVVLLGVSFVIGNYLLHLLPVVIGWVFYYFLTQKPDPAQILKVAFGLLALNLATNALNFYLPHGKYAMSETEDYGTIDENYQNVFAGLEENLPDDEWYRIGVSSKDNHVRNHYAYLDVNGLNSYASLTSGEVAEFSQWLESSQYQIIQPLRNGIDDRRIANQMLGVKYIITDAENAAYLPPGYTVNEALSEGSADMLVAETENTAPFAYVEEDVVALKETENWHPVQRESVLEDAVVVEGTDSSQAAPALNTHAFEIETGSGIQENEGTFEVSEKDSTMTLRLENPEDLVGQEVFFYIEGIDYRPLNDYPLIQESSAFRVNVSFNDQEKSVLQSNRFSFSSYFKRENILYHLGAVTEAEDSLTVEFEDTGYYDFDHLSVVSRPYNPEETAQKLEEKNAQALDISSFSNEQIEGRVDSAGGMLVTHIPYSDGWTVQIDGEEAAAENVNVGFIGVPISAGTHTVEFHYQTPWLKIGFVMTVMGMIGIGIVHITYRRLKND
jgi:uncharacterized membrane protein YfhO